ncbi:hypothetical protein JCM16303_002444 [Sporobolomyces ruberrimus]
MFLRRSRSSRLKAFKKLKVLVENESRKKITQFRSDNGGEFVSHAFDLLLAEHSIKRETPAPYSPESNGVAERVNHTIVEGLMFSLSQAGSPKDLWAEAVQAFVFVNRDFTRRIPDPPAPPIFEREVAPPPESPDPLDCLTDPFASTLAEVDALVASAGSKLEAAEDNFTLPSSDPRNHHEAMKDSDSFSQQPGGDFRETFAPVAKFVSICVLLALTARNNLLVHQADVDKAYLHGALDEEIYMRVPEGINVCDGKVLKLDRALCGLKQAGRVWNHRIDATLRALGYTKTKSHACVYMRESGGEHHYIALYVDDLLLVSKSIEEITRCKDGLREGYRIKGLGEAKFILGIQIHCRGDGFIFLSQRSLHSAWRVG